MLLVLTGLHESDAQLDSRSDEYFGLGNENDTFARFSMVLSAALPICCNHMGR